LSSLCNRGCTHGLAGSYLRAFPSCVTHAIRHLESPCAQKILVQECKRHRLSTSKAWWQLYKLDSLEQLPKPFVFLLFVFPFGTTLVAPKIFSGTGAPIQFAPPFLVADQFPDVHVSNLYIDLSNTSFRFGNPVVMTIQNCKNNEKITVIRGKQFRA